MPSRTAPLHDTTLLNELAAMGRSTNFTRGTVILKEGDNSNSLAIIIEGKVRVFSMAADGRQVVIDEHGPGQYVGEMSLDGQPRSASVMALTDCTVSIVEHDAVVAFIRTHPDFAFSLILKLVHRARLATENFKGLAFLNVYGRMARLLNSLAEQHDGKLLVADTPTQADIAQRVGASREMVSIIMRDLATGGYIEKSGRQLVIVKPLPERW